jgi:hypothetical protein
MRRDCSVSSSSFVSKPMRAANSRAPSPTSSTWSVCRITATATRDGVRTPSSAATAPAPRVGPCITDASSCTTPAAFGSPPYPTLVSAGSSSTMFTPRTTASSVSPPPCSTRTASATAAVPFELAIAVGRSVPR